MGGVKVLHLLEENGSSLADDVLAGLTREAKSIPSKWFYDDLGSELFEEITGLDEYYVTRRENGILLERADEIAALSGAVELVELGAGSSEKTRALLDSFSGLGGSGNENGNRNGSGLRKFVSFDVSEDAIRQATAALDEQYPDLEVRGIVGDFDHHLDDIEHESPCLFVFLGGTIGNLNPPQRQQFLADVAQCMKAGDTFLIGTDLVKPEARLHAAYNDARGVTADFNLNVLTVINRELNADFDLAEFEHVALWNAADSRVEMRLRSLRDQSVWIGDLDLSVDFAAGEEILTEISTKFQRDQMGAELTEAGLEVIGSWVDADADFQLTLAQA